MPSETPYDICLIVVMHTLLNVTKQLSSNLMVPWSKMIFKTQITIKDTPIDLARTAADIFSIRANECVTKDGRFFVAISGGTAPRLFHRMLVQEPYISKIPWDKMHIFWVDERCVPENDAASNYGAAKEDFLNRLPVSQNQIHAMPRDVPPEKGALKYQREIIGFVQLEHGEFPVFDLIFLGVGTDGHTASLFPGQQALKQREAWVVAVKGGNPNVNRLTLTYPVLNQARQIVFLVSGRGKSEILKTIFENRQAGLPAQMIQPINGKLIWLVDREAASLLPEEIIHE